jgi:hypothetical protein
MRLLAAALLLFAGTPQDSRVPVPPEAEQSRAEWILRDLFKQEFGKQTPQTQLTLARALLKLARSTADDPAIRYICYRESANQAARSPNPAIALSAAAELCKFFRLDAAALKHTLLAKLEPRLSKPEDFRDVCEAYLRLMDDDWESEQPAGALVAAKGAERAAEKAEDAALLDHVRARTKLLQELNEDREKAEKALTLLARSPQDPAANARVGEYFCFDRADWDKGLPYLSHVADPAVSGPAKKDLAKPSEPGEQVLIGDAWHDVAETVTSSWRKDLVLARAEHWYRLAVPLLKEPQKGKTTRRLEELRQRREPAPDALVGRWSFDEGEGTSIRDSSGRGNDGTLEKGVSRIEGPMGKGLSFDGTQGYASLGVGGFPAAEKAQTIAWAEKFTVYPKRSEHIVVLSDVPARLNLTAGHREDRIVVWKWGGVVLVSAPAPMVDEWHFLAYSFDGTTHKLYIDGFLKDQSTIPAQTGSYSKLELGRWAGHDGKEPFGFFAGGVDEVRIYARALSDDEVRLLARKQK